jgi:hypothetical protein
MLELFEMLGVCVVSALAFIMIMMSYRWWWHEEAPPAQWWELYDQYSPVALAGVVAGCTCILVSSLPL